MTMLDQSQQSDWLQTELESMSSQEDFPAKTSQSQDTKQALKASAVDYGQSAPVLLGSFDPGTPSLKTSQTCLNGERGDWFKRVLWDISQIGYDAEWHCIPASELGAHHHRDRVWIIAYPSSQHWGDVTELATLQAQRTSRAINASAICEDVADTSGERLQRGQTARNYGENWEEPRNQLIAGFSGIQGSNWETEPDGGRVAHGVPARSHRLKCLGNAVVPPIPELIGRAILEAN